MTDSNGNELPKSVWLPHDATSEQIGKALTVNSFLLAVEFSMNCAKTVVYDADTKTATIKDKNGKTTYISHK